MIHILLDNGHGVNTPGKRSPQWDDGTQLMEWEFNRHIVSRVEELLKQHGVPCTRLVPEADDISITERCRRANRLARQGDGLLVSVHANAGGGTGGEVFTFPDASESKRYAEVFRSTWHNHLPEFPFRGCKEANLGILRGSRCPALLTECLFMDTPRDCSVLLSPEGRERIAQWHAQSIIHIVQQF